MRLVTILIVLIGASALASTAEASGAKHCSHVRGYYDVRVKGVACHRAAHILWIAREGGPRDIEGWTCQGRSAYPGGGFPLEMVCRRPGKYARGWVIDGPA